MQKKIIALAVQSLFGPVWVQPLNWLGQYPAILAKEPRQ